MNRKRMSDAQLRFLIRQETETSLHHAREALEYQRQLNAKIKKREARKAQPGEEASAAPTDGFLQASLHPPSLNKPIYKREP